jgi:hypothetical protein
LRTSSCTIGSFRSSSWSYILLFRMFMH